MNEHLIGRGPQCALRLSASYVSGQHALVRWNGHCWEVLDRGSRNGTQVNGVALEPGRAQWIYKGHIITFGHEDEKWALVDTSEPQVMVMALDSGEAVLAAEGLIGLPSSKDPESTLYLDQDGAWKHERSDGVVEVIQDGQILECAGQTFRFCCPTSHHATESLAQLRERAAPTLCFLVSSDEDFVELSFEYPERKVLLGSRSHNYLMLTLARQRLADRAAGLPETSCGWMDKDALADGFKMTPQQVDGEVFRIRKHFSQHGLSESVSIIERRARTKQIRLGIERLRIDRS